MAEPKWEQVKEIANAILYEGHLLYPYRLSALKNRQRWMFGRVYPRAYSEVRRAGDAWFMQTECLVLGHPESRFGVRLRFLQLTWTTVVGGIPSPIAADAFTVRGERMASLREPVEREVLVADQPFAAFLTGPKFVRFSYPAVEGSGPSLETSDPADEAGPRWSSIDGSLELAAVRVDEGCYKLCVRVLNDTPLEGPVLNDEHTALFYTLLSAHTILEVQGGQFVSLLDPEEPFGPVAASCRNVGTWPVLIGDEGERNMMLSSPLILYDYPRVAPESPGDFFDGTEVDELLTLRVLTLTEQEKQEVRGVGGRAKALLERTEGLTHDQMLRLHGAVWSDAPSVLRVGARVRLTPRGRSDAMDLILSGKTATVVSVEEDYEGRIHLAVTVDEDPGQDLGRQGRPGHRFFFLPEEVEPLATSRQGMP